jgi:hypothetical protein
MSVLLVFNHQWLSGHFSAHTTLPENHGDLMATRGSFTVTTLWGRTHGCPEPAGLFDPLAGVIGVDN